MPGAVTTAGLSSQNPEGGGAGFFRRIGGALRSAMTGGIALKRPRRVSKPQATQIPSVPPDPASPSPPKPARMPRGPSVPEPRPPSRHGWLSRWFGRRPSQCAPRTRAPAQAEDDAPLPWENHPRLTPELRDFFNTPVAQCDPLMLRIVLSVIARQIAARMPAESGGDAQALFAQMWARLAPALETHARAGEAPSLPAADAAPDAPPVQESQAADAPTPSTAVSETASCQPAPRAALVSDGEAAHHAVPRTLSPSDMDRSSPVTPYRSGSVPDGRASQETHSQASPPCRRRPAFARHDATGAPRGTFEAWRYHPLRRLHRCRARLRLWWISALRSPRPPRRWCYAACAGPP